MTRAKKAETLHHVRCTAPGIKVEVGEHGHLFMVGDVVDLDALAAPGLTWRAALEAHLDHFESADDAPPTVGRSEE